MIHAILYVCPECKAFYAFTPSPAGHIGVAPLMCTEDGYLMKAVLVDNTFVDNLLKFGVPYAPVDTTRT